MLIINFFFVKLKRKLYPLIILKHYIYIYIHTHTKYISYLYNLMMWISSTSNVIMLTIHWRCQLGQSQELGQKSLKKALNELVQNIWSKMDLEGFGTFKEHEGQPLIHLV
jgi:hypothetical protein